jgi:hypothetical protein
LATLAFNPHNSTLEAYGIGDVPDWLVDEALELTITYFRKNALKPVECLEAHNNQTSDNNYQTQHWLAAQAEANKVLLGHPKYSNAMICLELS